MQLEGCSLVAIAATVAVGRHLRRVRLKHAVMPLLPAHYGHTPIVLVFTTLISAECVGTQRESYVKKSQLPQ